VRTDILLIPMGTDYRSMRAAALASERAGFDGIWTWDHLRSTDGGGETPEAWTVLSALAEAVPRVALGPLVLNVINRHPGVLANMAATLQQASGGRLLLGIGAGGGTPTPYAAEQRAIGQPVEPDSVRAQRVVEAIQVLRQLWSGDLAPFTGNHYRLSRPSGYLHPNPPPPIIVGAFGPRMAQIAGEHGDGINTQAGHPQLGRLLAIAREAHDRAGRDAASFIVTVFAGLSEGWLRGGSRQRTALEEAGTDRLILLLEPPYNLDTIAEAGRLLRG
jgi:alkanesulfonate monooxygenase SsuD/methylene tetrahydromethanopterin reductase-like flavin-dependent oxidoreductase (luciferase family)